MDQALWTAKTSQNVSEGFEKGTTTNVHDEKKKSERPSLVSRTIFHDVISNHTQLCARRVPKTRLPKNKKNIKNQNRVRKIASRAFRRKIRGFSDLYGDRGWNLDFLHDRRNQETADAVAPYRLSYWKNYRTSYKTTISLNLRVARGTFRPFVRRRRRHVITVWVYVLNVYRKSNGTVILLRFVSRPNRFGKRT